LGQSKILISQAKVQNLYKAVKNKEQELDIKQEIHNEYRNRQGINSQVQMMRMGTAVSNDQ